jgi:hypothetical protein
MMKVEIPISTTADTSGAQQQAQAIRQLKDETERYQAAVEKQKAAHEEATRAQQASARLGSELAAKAQEDAEMLERAAARRAKLEEKKDSKADLARYNAWSDAQEESARLGAEHADRQKTDVQLLEKAAARHQLLAEKKKLVAAADAEIAAGVKVVSKEEAAAAVVATEGANKSTKAKQDLKGALGQLGREFPVLGAAGRLLFSPLTAAAALAFVAIRHIKEGVANLNASLTTSEWESYGSAVAAREADFAAAASGANKLTRELEAIRTATDSASEASEKLMTVFRARQNAAERVDQAQKAAETARVQATEKDPVRRAEKLLEIETRYAERARRRAEESATFERNEQHRKLANEQVAVQVLDQQLEQARERQQGLRTEQEITQGIATEKGRLGAIDEEIKTKQARFDELMGGWGLGVKLDPLQNKEAWSLYAQLESLNAQRGLQAGVVKDREGRAPGLIEQWRASQENVGMLEGMQKGAQQRLSGMRGMLPTQEAVWGIEGQARGAESQATALTRTHQAAGEAQSNMAQLQAEIARNIESGKGVSESMLQQLEAQNVWLKELQRRINQLESGRNNGVRGAL